jgi:hypothetical protein
VFKNPVILSAVFTDIRVYQQSSHAVVEWKVANETNVQNYIIERSRNGRDFSKLGSKPPSNVAGAIATYSWVDENSSRGDNFYRIVSMDATGDKRYSPVVKLSIANGNTDVLIYPNPVINGAVKLQLSNAASGRYIARVIAKDGAVMMMKQFNCNTPDHIETLQVEKLASGNYSIELLQPDGMKSLTNLVIVK